jgi:coenzyme F420-0:L-glutamate ligase / coenzyme F420-1:gamma-L-glutamate ligase
VTRLEAFALPDLPEVTPGDDLAGLLAAHEYEPGDVLVIAHKIVSKAEGALRRLEDVAPTQEAIRLADDQAKDPRHVQVVLDESAAILRAQRGVLICRTHHGFVCANAGVDASNAPAEGVVVTLPRDPDASARALRAAIPGRPAIVIADSFGRAWRHAQCDVAIGIAGLQPIDDWRGRRDPAGLDLRATAIAVADEAAAAADLTRDKASREPAVVIRGLDRFVTDDDGPGAAALVRPLDEDLFG